jgi:hypothetical protein
LLILVLYLGSTVYVIGSILQVAISVKFDKPLIWKKLIISLILTRLFSICIALIIWKFWAFNFDIMQGPFFIPAMAGEALALALLWKFFRR